MSPYLNRKKLGMVVHACHPSYCGQHKKENCGPGWPGKKQDLISKVARPQKSLEA
jgi:hypothetical protein